MWRNCVFALLAVLLGCASPGVVGDRNGGTIKGVHDPFGAAESYCKKEGRVSLIGTYDADKGVMTFDCVLQN